MKHFIPLIIISLLVHCDSLHASELTRVSRVDTKDIIQLYFSFDRAPAFSETVNERRINLIFKQTQTVPDLKLFDGDSNIVKILSQAKNDAFVLSLFFRYKPQYHKFTKSSDNKIVFEVLLGNQFSKSYSKLADKLKGLTILDRNSTDTSNPFVLSPYPKDWVSFFSLYEAPVTYDIPVKFSLPPFPIIHLLPTAMTGEQQTLTPEMIEIASRGNWKQLAGLVLEKLQTEPDITRQKMLALTHGEILARASNFDDAFKQLFLLSEHYPDELIGNFAEYMLILIQAIHKNPFTANLEFKNLKKKTSSTNPISPYLHLSMIETALATSQHARLNKLLLQDNIAFPEEVSELIKVRQADYWLAIKQPVKAYVAYSLLEESSPLQTKPYSLNGKCTTLYNRNQFRQSAKCYDQLSSLSLPQNSLGLVVYRAQMARLKFQKSENFTREFTQIESVYQDTEAGKRAALKKIDLTLLQDKSRLRWALMSYRVIGNSSILRNIREEALFKQALILSLLNEKDKSIAMLQQILKEFRYGGITQTVQALLIELLPGQIKKLVDEKKYLEALVLAKQNKVFFQNNWISSKYLEDIADAYSKIGINNEAQRLYLYLIEIVPVDEKEKFYLPMITATFNYGNYTLVEDYGAQYSYNYPEGKFTDSILFFRLQALIAEERVEDALNLLPNPLLGNPLLYNVAASLFYRAGNYERCLNVFKILTQSKAVLSQEELFMYAETLLKTDHFKEAETSFLQITSDNSYFDQSLYRLAELERRKGDEKNALRLFKKIVETGTSDLWKRYAQKELRFADAAARM